jgi:protein arginine N-methyltransferase 1
LNTVTVDELAFKVPFDLKAERSDCTGFFHLSPRINADVFLLADIHAFLGWFDCSFDACHKPVKFSTGPHAKYTHWKVSNSSSRSYIWLIG